MNTHIKELAMEARGLKKETAVSSPFSILEADCPDVVVVKKTRRITKTMGILVSEKIYFVKTESPGKDAVVEKLTEDSYCRFTSGMPDLELPKGFWTKTLRPGITFARLLFDFLNNEVLTQMAAEHLLPEEKDFLYTHTSHLETAYTRNPVIYTMALKSGDRALELAIKEPDFCGAVADACGLSGLQYFFDIYNTALISLTSKYGYEYYRCDNSLHSQKNSEGVVFPKEGTDIERFTEYMLYDSVHMGYGSSPDAFINDWAEAVILQKKIYGKVVDIYPENLPTYVRLLRYKSSCLDQIPAAFMTTLRLRLCAMKDYNGEYSGMVFHAPGQPHELIDGLVSQATCLSESVDDIINGTAAIIFVENHAGPDSRLITVYAGKDGDIKAFREKNTPVSDGEMGIIREWIGSVRDRAD